MEGQKAKALDKKTTEAAEKIVQEANALWEKRSDEKMPWLRSPSGMKRLLIRRVQTSIALSLCVLLYE